MIRVDKEEKMDITNDFLKKIECVTRIRNSMDEYSQKLFDMRINYFINRDEQSFLQELDEIPLFTNKKITYWDFEKTYSQAKNICNNSIDIVIWGAGESGKRSLKSLTRAQYDVLGFCDNEKTGELLSKKIYSFEELLMLKRNVFWIISVMNPEWKIQIYDQLIRSGVDRNLIYLETNDQVLLYSDKQYFDLPELIPENNEVFVDCGSCNGYDSLNFVEWANGNAERIYALEPFDQAFNEVNKVLKNVVCEVEYEKVAAWNCKTQLSFSINKLGDSSVATEGEIKVNANTIDNILDGKRCTFIKMDIEGSELAALEGAAKTIKKYKPKLAICVYHKPEDIIEIPYFVYNLRNDYKFYIRHYAYPSTGETVMYAL